VKETRIQFKVLLSEQRNQVRTLLAFAGGDPREEITEVVFLTKPFDQELLHSLPSVPTVDVGGDCPDRRPEVTPSHAPNRNYREDASGIPSPQGQATPDPDPDPDRGDAWQ